MNQVETIAEPSTACTATGQSIPAVTIGLPVYNGDEYLGPAVDSILAQTFQDFRLIISDNASTDRTEAICRDYADRDPRVVYSRNEANIGGDANFNRVFTLADTPFFRWAAHDDVMAPTYLEKTMAVLVSDPGVAQCHCITVLVDEAGNEIRYCDLHLTGLDSPSAARRFRAFVLHRHMCTDIFGVFRTDALRGTSLHAPFGGSDRALLAEVALRGRFVRVPEPLFFNRDHPNRYQRAVIVDKAKQAAWHRPQDAKPRRMDRVTLYASYWRAVARHVQSPTARWSAWFVLIRWPFQPKNFVDVMVDILYAVSPSARRTVGRVARLVGLRR